MRLGQLVALLATLVAPLEYRSAALLLRQTVWDPIAAHLSGAKRVFVVPDGALNLVNLSGLPAGRSAA